VKDIVANFIDVVVESRDEWRLIGFFWRIEVGR
jgi:hypothetical protein